MYGKLQEVSGNKGVCKTALNILRQKSILETHFYKNQNVNLFKGLTLLEKTINLKLYGYKVLKGSCKYLTVFKIKRRLMNNICQLYQ